ncbi:anti-sigma factor antagonist [bacterium]|nr:MAG: anti-sigma factor antagonist [bacterium]
MKFDVELLDTVSVITPLKEKMDTEIAPEMKSQIVLTADGNEFGPLVLDLKNVTYADSSGLSALLLAHRIYRDTNRTLVLCSLNDRIQKLLDISQLTPVFEIESDRESALKRLQSN